MWIVAWDVEYYPTIYEFSSYEEAKDKYDEIKNRYTLDNGEKLYIAEVKEVAE